jgi:ubiquinone/menaquinone biosynthesis C-methylase UbiE
MTYQHFAYIYDELMVDVPYHAWIEYFQRNIKETSNDSRVLDLACGTGSLSIPLAKLGFEVTGLDLSSEMLSVAEEKARRDQVSITFLQQNMTELSGLEAFDYIVCFCDSLNYLEDEEEVNRTFARVYDQLKPGGIFMFDVHSVHKMENVFKNQTFFSNEENISYIWNCYEGEDPYSVEHDLTFFIKDSKENVYNRFDETHFQRSFPAHLYEAWLKEAGFTNISISADFETEFNTGNHERIFFCCQKK